MLNERSGEKMSDVDLVIKNAEILTLDNKNTRAKSVAVSQGRIYKVWPVGEPPEHEYTLKTNAEVIDLKGRVLIPGFIDTHSHLLMYAQFSNQVNCSSPLNNSIDDILDKLSKRVSAMDEGQWLLGWGYDNTKLEENRHPTRKDLDLVSKGIPIFLKHTSTHFGVANSKALEISGINENIKDPHGGKFGRDEDGLLNGVMYELPAMNLVKMSIPVPTTEELAHSIGEASRDYLAQGITTCTDAGVGLDFGQDELDAHVKAVEEGHNLLRMRFMILHSLLGPYGKFENYSAEQLHTEIQERSNKRAFLDSAKLFQDGSIQGFTGALREPYYTEPDIYGQLLHDQDDFNAELLDLHKRGFRIAIHGNGDRAIGSILDGYQYVLHNQPDADHRHRIEHAQTSTIADLDRMNALGVASSFFINHVFYWGDRHKKIFLGPERTSRINPLKDAADRDILYTLHSDCPITPISPLFSVWAAVNRQSKEGEIIGEDQRISVEKALKTMTIDGARLNFQEEDLGSIEIGKIADFAVLDTDPTAIDPMRIKDIKVMATFIEGEMVYKQNLSEDEAVN
jgi:hypothetical protein